MCSCVSPAAVVVRPVVTVPAVRGGEQGRGTRSAPAHPAGAAAHLSEPGPATLQQPHATGPRQGNTHTHRFIITIQGQLIISTPSFLGRLFPDVQSDTEVVSAGTIYFITNSSCLYSFQK